jgi:hypothetical protein
MRTSLQQVQSLLDPLQSYNWDIIIPNMPGTPDSRTFTYKAQSTSIPGFMMDSVPVALHGVELRFAGRANYSHSLQVTLLETRDVGTREMLKAWQRIARDWISNSGSYKSVYSVPVELVLYDDIPQEVRSIQLIGCWPETIDDVQVDNSQSSAVMTQVTFSYDYTYESSLLGN